jgi:ech hydrogenase subunit A
MHGLIARFPVITGITIAGIISMALMPFGVLVSKWAGIEAASSPSSWVPVICALLVGGSAATIIFWVKWTGRLLSRTPGAGE